MNKLTAALALTFIIFTFLSSVMEGGGGLNVTRLNGAITATVTTLPVDSTQGFLVADTLVIEDEELAYTGITAVSFTGVTRGYNRTTAAAHTDNTKVHSPAAGVLNRALGFNVISTGESAGTFAVINLTWDFLTKALPNLIFWDFSFFEGQLVYVRYLFMGISLGVVLYYGFSAISTAFGILRR